MARTKNFLLIPLVALFMACIFLRFYRLSEIGISFPDGFFYWQTAYDWIHGHESLTEHFRPFIYWVYAKVMALTGPNDTVLKVFNGICDSLVGGLLIYAGWLLRRSVILGLSAAISYLILLQPLFVARSETVHTSSTLFLMVTVVLSLRWTQKINPWLLFWGGIFLGMSWLTHPDLAVLGASVTFLILTKFFLSNDITSKRFWNFFRLNFGLFLLGYFALFILFICKFGLPETLESFMGNHKSQTKSLQGNFIWRLVYYSYHYIRVNLGMSGLILYLGSIILFLWKILQRKVSSQDFTLFVFPAVFLFLCALLFARTLIPRLLLPLVPIMILFIHVELYDCLKKFKDWSSVALMATFVIFNFSNFSFPRNQEVSIYRKIHETYNPFLTDNSKLLISPLTIHHIHAPLSKNVYLRGKGLYLSSTEDPTLIDAIKNNAITHVWIADIMYDERVVGKNFKETYGERLKSLYNKTKDSYRLEDEKDFLKKTLSLLKAKLIHKSEMGELYELK